MKLSESVMKNLIEDGENLQVNMFETQLNLEIIKMALITQLNDYRKKDSDNLSRSKKFLVKDVLSKYSEVYHIALRQLGKEGYKGKFKENKIGEETFFELLTLQERKNLEEITEKLGPILRGILKRIK